jgi:hypothetical protein
MRVHCEKPGERELRVVFSFDPADVRLEQTLIGVVVHLRDCRTAGVPGSPALPKYDARIALPARTRMTGVETRTAETIPIGNAAVPVAPLQLRRPGTTYEPRDDKQGLTVEPYPNPPFVPASPVLYEEAMRRPAARVINAEVQGLTPVVAVELNPVRLTPDARLELQSQIEVVISFERDDTLREKPSHIHSRAQAQRDVALTKRTVINRETVFDYSHLYPYLMTGVDYLIITNGDLLATFGRLAQWKRQRGLRARVVTVADIVGNRYGNFGSGSRDVQETIRRFLKFAYSDWGVAWVLLGGDTDIIPIRVAAGAIEGGIGKQATDPPPNNTMAWSGNHMRMHVLEGAFWGFGHSPMNLLVRYDTGMLIPYDGAGTSSTTARGWYFTTDETYAVRSTTPTEFIRVNGPAAEVNGDLLQFLYAWNSIPTDLYYSSLVGPQYDQPGKHDWDLLDNGVYGQHSNGELDGINYLPTVSLGRAPVRNAAEADVFVNKVIAYEKYERPDGTALDGDWPRRVLLVSENWGGRIDLWPTTANPPGDNQFRHVSGEPLTIIKLKDTPDYNWSLIAAISEADARELPYTTEAPVLGRGWYFATSATNLNPAALHIPLPGGGTVTLPQISNWIAVFGTAEELNPPKYQFNHVDLDWSAADQEQLREQLASQMPGFNSFRRLYEDIQDMTPAQVGAAPLELITTARLHDELDRGPHIVSLSGHGYWGGCCKLGYDVADTVTNGYHTFIAYADSCLTNQFEGDAMSEHLLRNPNGGAVAYVGNTRFSWIGNGDDIQRRFFQEWASLAGDAHLGLLFDTRALTFADMDWMYGRWATLALNLMGDPEMPLWWRDPFKIRIPDLVLIDVFKLLIDEPDPPEPWFEEPYVRNWTQTFVHLQQGDVERQVLADNGRVEIPLTEFRAGPATVTISRPGHKPVVRNVTIQKASRRGCLGWLFR